MKYLPLFLGLIILGCNAADTSVTEEQRQAFAQMAQDYQTTYMGGAANLDQILAGMDPNIKMWENGKIWTYDDMVKFGPHLPEKAVLDTYNEQLLIDNKTGYDFVTLRYISPNTGDTMRETASRVWMKQAEGWKITKMSNLIHPENCE